MSLTIEQSQQILDLRQRMAQNVRDGKEAHAGLTPEDYNQVLDAIRGNRANAVAAGEKKKAAAGTRGKKKADAALETAPKPGEPSKAKTDPRFAKFAKFNFD